MRGPDNSKNAEQAQRGDDFRLSAPPISLPKGGGAIRGLGEKFAANPVTGAGSMSVPLAISPGRSGFGPQLTLAYDSSAGNGPFGFGWNLSLPGITRKTDKGLPQYGSSTDAAESDVFILSGAEDLVSMLRPGTTPGSWLKNEHGRFVIREEPRVVDNQTYMVRRYQPRIEGLFALIERWAHRDNPAEIFWRSLSRDNVSTWYGRTPASRIADPADPARIFSWLICETHDDKGNVVVYEYKPENDDDLDLTQANERNRTPATRSANRYLKHIRYGNHAPYLPQFSADQAWPAPPADQFFFEIVFDYGEHHATVPVPAQEISHWPARSDAFSSYRAGFEIRTYRLCQRVLMFHHFPGKPGVDANCLVRSTDFKYSRQPESLFAFLDAVMQSGYRREGAGYFSRALPPLEFEYTQPRIDGAIHEIDAASLENLPYGLDGKVYRWVDLDGAGIPGILSEQADAWFYKRNLSPVSSAACFAPMERVAEKPAFVAARANWQFQDLAGNGKPDLACFEGPAAGFFQRNDADAWDEFKAFQALPKVDWRDPNLRFVDLTGDGLADILVTESQALTWYASLGETGFAAAARTLQALDEELGPRLVFADADQSIYLADFSGDGLTDLVRIRNGEVCYWPNLGYGRFGAKVTMDGSPWFEAPDQFSQHRIRLADVDGSGVTDIVYLGRHSVAVYFNQSGNRWSDAQLIEQVPPTDNLTALEVVDLFGNGTACLVWSSPLPGDALRPMRYVDLMGGQKPHLLVGAKNNLGAATRIDYAASTKFYLQDQAAGRPWLTKLPFPVHVVERMTVTDQWRSTKFSSTYSYHHGYFDGGEREFRGFGRVEQIDTEDYGTFAAGNTASPYITADHTLYQPPVKTITWFHTGAATGEHTFSQFKQEYFPASLATVNIDQIFQEKTLPQPELAGLNPSAAEWLEAWRACKGSTLRQEVYELDVETRLPVRLFSTATHNCNVRCLQPRGDNPHAVFLVTETEALSYHYELDLRQTGLLKPDPRVSHTLNLSFDVYGNVQQAVSVGYERLRQFDEPELAAYADLIREAQRERHVAYNETRYTDDAIDKALGTAPIQYHRLRVPCEVRSYELTGMVSPQGRYLDLAYLRSLELSSRYPATAPTRPISTSLYHLLPQTNAANLRLIEHARTLFFDDDATGVDAANRFLKLPMPLGTLGKLGLVYEQYKLALTDSLLDAVFTDGQRDDSTPDASTVRIKLRDPLTSGYISGTHFQTTEPQAANEYWLRSGVAGFATDAARHFYLPERYTDAFNNPTQQEYDSDDLFIRSSSDALNNTASVERFDYRVLAPLEKKDPSGNFSAVAFDVLGLPVAAATLGKQRTESGDNLTGLLLDLPVGAVERFFTASYDESIPVVWLGAATSRFVYDFGEHVAANGSITYGHRPAATFGIARENHVLAGAVQIQVGVEYSDGMGAVLVRKSQAEPDPDSTQNDPSLRWIANGKTVVNNKGKPVKQYEPYFSAAEHRFDTTEAENGVGVTPLMYYDAAGRLLRTELPDGTLSRVEFSPWHVASFDGNDAVLESQWYQDHGAPNPARALTAGASPDTRAAWLAAKHASTPAVSILDSLGRNVIAIAHNKVADGAGSLRDERYCTYTRLDAEGKPLWVRDARGNLVMQYVWPTKPHRDEPRIARDFNPTGNSNKDIGARVPTYDIAGNLLFQHGMDAGDRWVIHDAAGKPMFAWDRNQRQDSAGNFPNERRMYWTQYDALHRPTATWLSIDDNDATMIERCEYQDGQLNDAKNLNGQRVRHYDASGCTEIQACDFKSNVLEVRRRLNNQPQETIIDWQTAPEDFLETEAFRQITEFDALNRMTRLFNWHRGEGSRVAVYKPSYSRRGLLQSEQLITRAVKATRADGRNDYDVALDVTMPRAFQGTRTHDAIGEVRYNAKGQKTYLALGNGTITQYEYDPKTFYLSKITTRRPVPATDACSSSFTDAAIVQDLRYTYDPVGNITQIFDAAQRTAFFGGQRLDANNLYEYDALYRLTFASGKENGAATGAPDASVSTLLNASCPAPDPAALRNYVQSYAYDSVGNIMQMRHAAGDGSWTRDYAYAFDDMTQPASNRLWQTWTSSDRTQAITYQHDAHGNVLNLERIAASQFMRWEHRDLLSAIHLGGGGDVYYQYDAGKQRTRKRIVNQNQTGYTERIYLDGLELYRRYEGVTLKEEVESLHLFHDKQRILLVDDVIETDQRHAGGAPYRAEPLLRYQYGNHLNSACLELDAQALLISYEEFHPHGASAFHGRRSDSEAPPKRYRHAGMERDEESSLYYHGARYSIAWLGRWASCDPLGLADGPHLYSLCQNNPIRFTDPHGTQAKDTAEPDPYRSHAGPLMKMMQVLDRAEKVEASKQREQEMDKQEVALRVREASNLGGFLSRIAHSTQQDRAEEKKDGIGFGVDWLIEATKNKKGEANPAAAKKLKAALEKRGLPMLSCLSLMGSTLPGYANSLDQADELKQIFSRAEDARGTGSQAVFGGRGTVLLEGLRTRMGFDTVHVDSTPGEKYWNVKNYTSEAGTLKTGTVPNKEASVTGADSGQKIDVRVTAERFVTLDRDKKNKVHPNADSRALWDQLKNTEFAVGIADSGYHTYVISRGMVYEIHWDKGPKNPELTSAISLEAFFTKWGSGVIAVPPSVLK